MWHLFLNAAAFVILAGVGSAEASSGGVAKYWAGVKGDGRHFKHTGITRTYYIQAEEEIWDYAPTGSNQISGTAFSEEQEVFVSTGPGRIGSKYLKCLYRGYKDASFKKRSKRRPNQEYLALQGPVVYAEVGDKVVIVYRNRCRFPNSVHVHGFEYTKPNEGAPYADDKEGGGDKLDGVPPGGQATYHYEVPEQAGPGEGDGSSVMWMYHSHTDEVMDTYAGLMGSIVVTKRGMARADGSPKDVDREVFVLWSVMNENLSWYIKQNLRRFARPPRPLSLLEDEDFEESNLMHAVNGRVYGNLPMIDMCAGARVRWYLMGMGTEVDLHTPHWHGNVVSVMGQRMDVVNLLPASMVVADMVPYNLGIWLYHCHVNDHIIAGMQARYRVRSCGKGKARHHL